MDSGSSGRDKIDSWIQHGVPVPYAVSPIIMTLTRGSTRLEGWHEQYNHWSHHELRLVENASYRIAASVVELTSLTWLTVNCQPQLI